MKHYFNEVGITIKRSGRCPVCEKMCSRSNYFYQTLNPFNKNKDGSLKTREQIYTEINKEADEWNKLPVTHVKCE